MEVGRGTNQRDEFFMSKLFKKLRGIDNFAVIDDGSHRTHSDGIGKIKLESLRQAISGWG